MTAGGAEPGAAVPLGKMPCPLVPLADALEHRDATRALRLRVARGVLMQCEAPFVMQRMPLHASTARACRFTGAGGACRGRGRGRRRAPVRARCGHDGPRAASRAPGAAPRGERPRTPGPRCPARGARGLRDRRGGPCPIKAQRVRAVVDVDGAYERIHVFREPGSPLGQGIEMDASSLMMTMPWPMAHGGDGQRLDTAPGAPVLSPFPHWASSSGRRMRTAAPALEGGWRIAPLLEAMASVRARGPGPAGARSLSPASSAPTGLRAERPRSGALAAIGASPPLRAGRGGKRACGVPLATRVPSARAAERRGYRVPFPFVSLTGEYQEGGSSSAGRSLDPGRDSRAP